ncbi:MAG: hypothetical protein Q8O67_32005 [Deltaproteobacteria bacterium]|nr:hypothetical protein [Deltaproteobacteria bacterium]
MVVSHAVTADLQKKGVDVGPAVRDMINELKSYACRSKQGDAKALLRGLFTAEDTYRMEHDTYDKDLKKIDFTYTSKHYAFEIVSASANAFRARATGLGDMKGDVWEVDEKKGIVNVTPLCGK